MKRKLVEQGGTTLMVSLPSKWAKQFSLKKGDEIDVSEQGPGLFVSVDKNSSPEKTEINISGLKPIIKRALGALYKKGYDDISVVFENPEELKIAQEVINQEFVGFEIISQGKKTFNAKKISSIEHSEFDAALKRVFMFLFSVGTDTVDSAKQGDIEEAKSIALRDVNINKLCDFCRRSLNQKGYADPKKTNLIYFVVEELEKIGDVYKKINSYIVENSIKPSKDIVANLSKLGDYLRQMFDLFYKFDIVQMNEFYSKRSAIEKDLEKLYSSVPQKQLKIVFYLELLKSLVFDCNGAIMAMNL